MEITFHLTFVMNMDMFDAYLQFCIASLMCCLQVAQFEALQEECHMDIGSIGESR